MYSPWSDTGIPYMSSKNKGKAPQKRTANAKSMQKGVQARRLLNLVRNFPLSRLTVSLPMGLPEKIRIPLRYTSRVVIDADVDSDTVIAMNGVYDPDITGVGHQPRLFDQMMGLYQRYRVLACAASYSFAPVATTNAGACFVGILATLSATNLEGTGLNALMDNSAFNYKISNGLGSAEAIKIEREDALSAVIDSNNDDSEYGSSSANPGTIGYYHLYVASLDVTTALTGQSIVTLIQDVEFSRRVDVASS